MSAFLSGCAYMHRFPSILTGNTTWARVQPNEPAQNNIFIKPYASSDVLPVNTVRWWINHEYLQVMDAETRPATGAVGLSMDGEWISRPTWARGSSNELGRIQPD